MLNYLDKMDLNIFTVDYYCVEWWCAGRTYPVGVTSRVMNGLMNRLRVSAF